MDRRLLFDSPLHQQPIFKSFGLIALPLLGILKSAESSLSPQGCCEEYTSASDINSNLEEVHPD
jgi:hypothetical protein